MRGSLEQLLARQVSHRPRSACALIALPAEALICTAGRDAAADLAASREPDQAAAAPIPERDGGQAGADGEKADGHDRPQPGVIGLVHPVLHHRCTLVLCTDPVVEEVMCARWVHAERIYEL